MKNASLAIILLLHLLQTHMTAEPEIPHVLLIMPAVAGRNADIVAFDGKLVSDVAALKEAVSQLPKGSKIALVAESAMAAIPLSPTPHLTTDAFRELCAQHGLQFSETITKIQVNKVGYQVRAAKPGGTGH